MYIYTDFPVYFRIVNRKDTMLSLFIRQMIILILITIYTAKYRDFRICFGRSHNSTATINRIPIYLNTYSYKWLITHIHAGCCLKKTDHRFITKKTN